VISIVENGVLKGYIAFQPSVFDGVEAYGIEEICADSKVTSAKLIDQLIDRSAKDKIDFVFMKKTAELYDDVLSQKGFVSFVESVIMVVLLNPKELLLALSDESENGKTLELIIKGFDPVKVKIGQKGIKVVEDAVTDFTVSMDSKTFLRLFFGEASFLREFVRRRIRVKGMLNLHVIRRFFNLIRQGKVYIPYGDWV